MADEAHEQIHVDADPERCFALAAGFEAYPDWTGDVKEATVLDYDFTDAPRGFSWSLVEGDMLRALDGEYGFTRDGDGTLVDYHLRVDLAIPLPGLIKRRRSEEHTS